MPVTTEDVIDFSRHVQRARAQDFSRLKYEKALEFLTPIFNRGIGRQAIIHGDNHIWHRLRKLQTPTPISQVRHLSINRQATRFNRANGPGQPVFYASRSRATALAEMDVQSGQLVQFVAARPREGMTLRVDVIGEIEHFANTSLSMLGDAGSVDSLTKVFQEDFLRSYIAVLADAYIAELFANPDRTESAYVACAILAWHLFGNVEAIAYPSVRHKGGLNVAVPVNVFDNKFEIVSSDVFFVTGVGYGQYLLAPVQTSRHIENDGTIVWSDGLEARPGETWSWAKGMQVPPGTVGWWEGKV